MMPKAVQDAGYTAVGIGVLALQQVQTHRREIAHKVGTELGAAGRQAHAALADVKAKAAPVTSRLESLPRLPGPVGQVIEGGKARLCQALRPAGS
jgi:sRNA-binding carbon storage regulator CsrA